MILAAFPVFFWRHTGVMLEIFPEERLAVSYTHLTLPTKLEV